jgi:hypothetical protein
MDKLYSILKSLALRFLDFVVVGLVLFLGLIMIYISGAFISNIANAFRLNGYIDPLIGMQIILVSITTIWIPILIIKAAETRLR